MDRRHIYPPPFFPPPTSRSVFSPPTSKPFLAPEIDDNRLQDRPLGGGAGGEQRRRKRNKVLILGFGVTFFGERNPQSGRWGEEESESCPDLVETTPPHPTPRALLLLLLLLRSRRVRSSYLVHSDRGRSDVSPPKILPFLGKGEGARRWRGGGWGKGGLQNKKTIIIITPINPSNSCQQPLPRRFLSLPLSPPQLPLRALPSS